MDSGLGGALAPGVGGPEWDTAVWNRIVVFRDFAGRFAGVQKCAGRSLISREEIGETGKVIGFDVDALTGGLRERIPGAAKGANKPPAKVTATPTKSRKRYFDEIADSEGEEDEYGWGEGDEHAFAAGEAGESGGSAMPTTQSRQGVVAVAEETAVQ